MGLHHDNYKRIHLSETASTSLNHCGEIKLGVETGSQLGLLLLSSRLRNLHVACTKFVQSRGKSFGFFFCDVAFCFFLDDGEHVDVMTCKIEGEHGLACAGIWDRPEREEGLGHESADEGFEIRRGHFARSG